MIRLAHLSDIHVSARKLEWQIHDFLNKRFAGWINHRWLGRRFRFRHAQRVLKILFQEIRDRRPDRIVFSGDATALGFEAELRIASELMGVANDQMPSGLAVPGNHDYATRRAAASGLFERYFAPWQRGERVEEAHYPFAQQVGDYWLVAVNSSTGNRMPWDASGCVGPHQTERLRQLLEKLPAGPRILVTHYPVCLATGKDERRFRRLKDLRKFMEVAVEGKVCLWLHGHRHKGYYLTESAYTPFPVICAGSATQTRLWSYCEYTLDGHTCKGLRRIFDPKQLCFRDGQTFEIPLPIGKELSMPRKTPRFSFSRLRRHRSASQ